MKKRIKILSIDSGGMRGVIPAMVVAEIERRTGRPISQMFDLVSGTSTGGIVAAHLVAPAEDGSPKYSGKDMVKLYEDEGPKIFAHSMWRQILSLGSAVDSKYPLNGMKEVFDRLLGQIELKDALTEVLIPTFELEMGAPFFFKRHDARTDPAKNFLLQQVVCATAAAPTFFEPYVIESRDVTLLKHLVFVDGGVVASNPTMCAYTEAKKLFPHADEYLIVSLGTGEYSSNYLYETTKRWGAAQWMRPLLRILMSGSVDIVDHQMRTLLNTEGDSLNHYYRFQVPIMEATKNMDDATEIAVHKLELIGENLIRDSDHQLSELCALL